MISRPKSKYLTFTFLFLVFAFLVYCTYIFTGRTFVKGTEDGLRQHLVALTYYGNFLRTLLSGSVIQWDFNIGEGSDVFQTLSYYVIGDPFTLLAVLFPTKYMYVCYTLISLLKLYCAGLAFIYMCRHFKVESGTGTLVAALSYCFSAWAFIHSTRHLYFINPMIYMPLIAVGINKLLREKKPVLFTASVAVAGVSNLYFFYMIALLAAIYVLALLVCEHGKNYIAILRDLLTVAVYAVAGTLMAMVMILPVLYFFFTDSRAGFHAVNLFFPPEVYLKLPIMFFAPEGTGYASWMGLSAVVFMGSVSLFLAKGNRLLKTLMIICIAFFLFPFFGQMLNGFFYPSHRWCWAFILLCCYVMAKQWKILVQLDSRAWLWSGCLLTLYLILFHLVYPKDYHRVITFVYCAFFFVIWLFSRKTQNLGLRQSLLIFFALATIVLNANYRFYGCGWLNTCYPPERLKVLSDNEITSIKELGDSGFYRFSGDNLTFNANMLNGLSSPQYYWSMTNRSISEFRRSLGRDDNLGYHRYCDYDSRSILESLACVRYYYTKDPDRVPYGFEPTVKKDIYKNSNSLPFGYTYNSYITRAEFEKYPETKKQQILLGSVVLESDAAFPKKESFAFNDKNIEYKIEADDGIAVEKNRFVVSRENASLKLKFHGEKDAETYLYLKGIDFEGKSSYHHYQYSYYRVPVYVVKQDGKKREFEYCLPREAYYVDLHTFVLNLGYSKEPQEEVTLTFDKKGIYSFDEVAVVCQTFNDYPSQIEALKKDAWTDVHFGINQVSGIVDLSADKLLLISIPYAKGWSAFVDGQKTEILQGNIMNMALPMKQGKHTVELVYETPLLKTGFFISLFTIVYFSVFILRKRRSEHNIKA